MTGQKFEFKALMKRGVELVLRPTAPLLLLSPPMCPWRSQAVEHRIREEQRAMDQKIVLELDRKVADQQSTLEKAGVTGFYVTTNPQVSPRTALPPSGDTGVLEP